MGLKTLIFSKAKILISLAVVTFLLYVLLWPTKYAVLEIIDPIFVYFFEKRFSRQIIEMHDDKTAFAISATVQIDKPPFLALTNTFSIRQGEELIFYYLTDSSLKLRILKRNRKVESITDLEKTKSLATDGLQVNSQIGFDLSLFKTIELKTAGLEPGIHNAEFSNSKMKQTIPFVILPRDPPFREIAYVMATNTIVSYSDMLDIRTNYRNLKGLPGVWTRPRYYPYDQPLFSENESCSHLAGDQKLLDWLRAKKILFDVITDSELADFNNIQSYKTLIFGMHNEYWFESSIYTLEKFIKKSRTKVLVFGGNTAWKIFSKTKDFYYIEHEKILYNKALTARRNKMLGTIYTALGFQTYAPFSIVENKHPVFKGIEKTVFGNTKRACQSYKKGRLGASGMETDKLSDDSDFTLLAKGSNKSSIFMSTGADMVFKRFDNGSEVFNASSVEFLNHLNDPSIEVILENLLLD